MAINQSELCKHSSRSGQLNIGHSMAYPVYANNLTCSVSASRAATRFFAVSENSKLKSFCGNELQAWYSSYTQQYFTPKSIPEEKFYISQCAEATPNQKRFLVFDQSGNRTRLVFNTVGGYPFQYPFCSNSKPSDGIVSKVELPIDKDSHIPDSVNKASWDGLDEKHEKDVSGSEMHEDTEELDALLCSDDEDEDEETSTGHSPSEMTGFKNNEVDDSAEVASSVTPSKRSRLEGEHDPSLVDTANSGKEWDYEDDAQSSCIKGGTPGEWKRLRSERIRETVGVLRSIIPGGRGKDAVVVLDEAIHYLKSMKVKALGAAANSNSR